MSSTDYKPMTCTTTPAGGVVIAGSNPAARFCVEFNAAGELVGKPECEVRAVAMTDAVPTDAGDCSGCNKKRAASVEKRNLEGWNQAFEMIEEEVRVTVDLGGGV